MLSQVLQTFLCYFWGINFFAVSLSFKGVEKANTIYFIYVFFGQQSNYAFFHNYILFSISRTHLDRMPLLSGLP